MENIIRERRMRSTRHMMRMDQESMTTAAVRLIPPNGKRKPDRPRSNWIQTVMENTKRGEPDGYKFLSWQSTKRPGRS